MYLLSTGKERRKRILTFFLILNVLFASLMHNNIKDVIFRGQVFGRGGKIRVDDAAE